jgi:hypothetical protein
MLHHNGEYTEEYVGYRDQFASTTSDSVGAVEETGGSMTLEQLHGLVQSGTLNSGPIVVTRRQVSQVFDAFDLDGSGRLNVHEFALLSYAAVHERSEHPALEGIFERADRHFFGDNPGLAPTGGMFGGAPAPAGDGGLFAGGAPVGGGDAAAGARPSAAGVVVVTNHYTHGQCLVLFKCEYRHYEVPWGTHDPGVSDLLDTTLHELTKETSMMIQTDRATLSLAGHEDWVAVDRTGRGRLNCLYGLRVDKVARAEHNMQHGVVAFQPNRDSIQAARNHNPGRGLGTFTEMTKMQLVKLCDYKAAASRGFPGNQVTDVDGNRDVGTETWMVTRAHAVITRAARAFDFGPPPCCVVHSPRVKGISVPGIHTLQLGVNRGPLAPEPEPEPMDLSPTPSPSTAMC